MSDNLTELIVTETPPIQNPGIPDNLALISAIITIVLGGIIIVAAMVMLFRRGVFKRFYRKVKKTLKSDSVTFLLQNNSCSHTVGEFVEKDLQNATSVIIIWQNGEHIDIVTDENLDIVKAVGMVSFALNNLSKPDED